MNFISVEVYLFCRKRIIDVADK